MLVRPLEFVHSHMDGQYFSLRSKRLLSWVSLVKIRLYWFRIRFRKVTRQTETGCSRGLGSFVGLLQRLLHLELVLLLSCHYVVIEVLEDTPRFRPTPVKYYQVSEISNLPTWAGSRRRQHASQAAWLRRRPNQIWRNRHRRAPFCGVRILWQASDRS